MLSKLRQHDSYFNVTWDRLVNRLVNGNDVRQTKLVRKWHWRFHIFHSIDLILLWLNTRWCKSWSTELYVSWLWHFRLMISPNWGRNGVTCWWWSILNVLLTHSTSMRSACKWTNEQSYVSHWLGIGSQQIGQFHWKCPRHWQLLHYVSSVREQLSENDRHQIWPIPITGNQWHWWCTKTGDCRTAFQPKWNIPYYGQL